MEKVSRLRPSSSPIVTHLSVALHQIVADALILPAGDSGKKKNDKQAASTSAR